MRINIIMRILILGSMGTLVAMGNQQPPPPGAPLIPFAPTPALINAPLVAPGLPRLPLAPRTLPTTQRNK